MAKDRDNSMLPKEVEREGVDIGLLDSLTYVFRFELRAYFIKY